LLVAVSNLWNATPVSTFAYGNDALARRTHRVDNAAVTNEFGYNPRSELTNVVMPWASGTNRFAYAYDPIGNRTAASSNLTGWTYQPNALNQYTNITDGGTVEPRYDLDGNMVTNGAWTFSWDGENRLVGASKGATIAAYQYDYMSRRSAKAVNGVTNTFLYDGWNLVREVSSCGVTNSYVWGLDLSGSAQGAGGIGGLLSVTRSTACLTATFYACQDGNGNITDYVDTNGVVVAHREYDAFGNTILATGTMVNDFNFWFSSKYTDEETGLVYYGYRYYSPGLGRWLSRDPIWELAHRTLVSEFANADIQELIDRAGPNVFAFCFNDSIGKYDPNGEAVPAVVVAAVAVLAAAEACGLPFHLYALDKYDDAGDSFRHCWVSCAMARTCGPALTELAGLGKEIRDRAVAVYCDFFPNSRICQGGHGSFWDSIDDLAANQKCIAWEGQLIGPITWLYRESCDCCCRREVGYSTSGRD
jgi:RHS repeat-associated protein